MLNFLQIIPLAAKAAGEKPVLAAPYPLSETLCRGLVSEGVISGYIADRRPDPACRDPIIAGWWTDRPGGTWFIRSSVSQTLILLSGTREYEVGGRMLLEARLKGIRRILLVDTQGSIVSDVDVGAALMRRLEGQPGAKEIHQLSYADAFEDMYALVGDRLRLPFEAFSKDRTLIITGSFQAGGAERQTAYTVAGLERRSPGTVFVGRARAGSSLDFYMPIVDAAGAVALTMPESSEEYESREIIQIREGLSRYSSLGFLDIFYMIFHYALMIRSVRPGLVHSWQEYSNVFGGIAADLVGVPRLVLSGRSVAPDNFLIFQPYMEPAYRALLKRRNPVFLNNSEAGALDYARWLKLPTDRFRVIQNGFEFPLEQPSARLSLRQELGLPEDAVVVGGIFRFGEEKRPQLWLDMAVELHRTHPEIRFVVFGEGPLLETSRAFVASSNLSDVIKLPGFTANSWAAISAMDIFVLSSRMEGFPNVLVEAQAMGCPIVCTGRGGMFETFLEGRTGFGVQSETAEAMAQAVCQLVDNPELLRAMGASAYTHARDCFGVEHMVDRTLAVYREAEDFRTDILPEWKSADAVTRQLGGILKSDGYCFVADVPVGIEQEALQLWEDDRSLGPVTGRAEVRDVGVGRYEIADRQIFLSSSDGSDIRFNGRSYRLRTKLPDHDEIVLDPERLTQELGRCFIAKLTYEPGLLRFTLLEDDKAIGPGGCLHDEIRVEGGGRYSIWGESLYFSTSDNSDPRTSGRTYTMRREKLVEGPAEDVETIAGASLHRVMRQLLDRAAPRRDYVPGRIVHVGGSLGPGGAERQQLYTLSGLGHVGCIESAQLLCYYLGATQTDRFDFYLPAFRAAGVPVRLIRRQVGPDDPGRMPPSVRKVRNLLPGNLATDIADLYWEFSELRPEVVHAWLDGNNERAGIAAALAGVPRIVLSGRNLNPSHFSLYASYMDPAYRALLQLPQVKLINNSRAGADDYADWLGVERRLIRVVHNGVDFRLRTRLGPHEVRRQRRELSLDPNAFLVGGVFRFSTEKRPLLWVETAAELARRLPNASFVIFGHGEKRAEMEAAIAGAGLTGRIVLAGVTSDVLEALSMMDVLLLTSEAEGLPNVVLESQWVGTPVVATRAGGTAEALKEGITGWIAEPANPVELADRLQWLHDNPAVRSEVLTRGPEFVKERFGVERMLEETLRVYGNLGAQTEGTVRPTA